MKQGVAEPERRNEHMIALAHEVQDGIDLRWIRLHTGSDDDIRHFSFLCMQRGGCTPVDGDGRIRKEMRQAFISDKSAVRYFVLTPESDPAIQPDISFAVTGSQDHHP